MKAVFNISNGNKLVVLMTMLLLGFFLDTVASASDQRETKAVYSIGDFPGTSAADKASRESNPESTEPGKKGDGSKIFPAVWCADITDEKTKMICWDAYRSSLDYYKGGLEQRSKVFKWQHITTKVIFFVVLILVAIGVYFAWIQFRTGKGEMDRSELEISLQGIKVNSSVLGIIILMISLVFFYLYLRYVYPISELF